MVANGEALGRARRVALVDDELGPRTFTHLPDDVRHVLSDPNDPDLAAVWALGHASGELPDMATIRPADVQQHVESEAFINRVLLREEFLSKMSEPFQARFSAFSADRLKVAGLKRAVETAFPQPEFEVVLYSSRPAPSDELLGYDFLIMDFVMDAADPIVSLSTYLRELSQAAGDRTIPPILLISQRGDDLARHTVQFRTSGEISAAGLAIAPKQTLASKEFGADGLKLLRDQMNRQTEAAHQMRVLCRTWNQALEFARVQTATTLWNLDAAALQEIHRTARFDNDPFEGHLHELVSREHLWHLEHNSHVHAAISALGSLYDSLYDNTNAPKIPTYRYSAHASQDMATLRTVERHYFWRGTTSDVSLSDHTENDFTKNLSRVLPVGATLRTYDRSKQNEREVLIHVTQECDLNKPDPLKRNLSLYFARASVVKPGSRPQEEVRIIKAIRLDDEDADLHVDKAQLIAIPFRFFLKWKKRWRLTGFLRPDIARQLLQESLSHATRTAAFATTGARQREVRLCLRIGQPNGAAPIDAWYGTDGKENTYANAVVIVASATAVTANKHLLHFLDDSSFNLTVWIHQQLQAIGRAEDASTMLSVCDRLRQGVQLSGEGDLSGQLRTIGIEATREVIDSNFSSAQVGARNPRILIAAAPVE